MQLNHDEQPAYDPPVSLSLFIEGHTFTVFKQYQNGDTWKQEHLPSSMIGQYEQELERLKTKYGFVRAYVGDAGKYWIYKHPIEGK